MESDKINPEHYKRLPAEAINIIEAAIQNAPTCQDAYLHGQALKYLLRCWHKEGITDVKKAKWYLDRLIEHCDVSIKPTESPKKSIELPDGWRWLEIGEVIRKGDEFFKDDNWWDYDLSIGERIWDGGWPSIRRNRFKVGEKVVGGVPGGIVFQVMFTLENNFYDLKTEGGFLDRLPGNDLAPYIEDAK